MSHLQYFSYPGWGQVALARANMSQAVRVPPGETIQISGQGGWDRDTEKPEVSASLSEEISRAFNNVHETIFHAGGPGMSSVYKLVIDYCPYTEEASKYTFENMRKWFSNHPPLITAIGVEKLALEGMRIEIEAWAHLG